MKRILALLLTLVFVFSAFTCFAETEANEIKLVLNEEEIVFDQGPVIVDEEVMLPLRAIFEKLGMVVSWDNDTNTAAVVNSKTVIFIQIDNTNVFKGENMISVRTPAILLNDRTLISVETVNEIVDCVVDYNKEDGLVTMTTLEETTEEPAIEETEKVEE